MSRLPEFTPPIKPVENPFGRDTMAGIIDEETSRSVNNCIRYIDQSDAEQLDLYLTMRDEVMGMVGATFLMLSDETPPEQNHKRGDYILNSADAMAAALALRDNTTNRIERFKVDLAHLVSTDLPERPRLFWHPALIITKRLEAFNQIRVGHRIASDEWQPTIIEARAKAEAKRIETERIEAEQREQEERERAEAEKMKNDKAKPKREYDYDRPDPHDENPNHADAHKGWSPPHYDLFNAIAVPDFNEKHIHPRYREMVMSNSLSHGYDAGALWECIVAVWSSFIPADSIRIKPSLTNAEWLEAPRLNVVICGEAGTGKSTVQRNAVKPLVDIDAEDGKTYGAEKDAWDHASPEEREDMEKPKRITTLVDSDFSTEGLQRTALENPRGMLIHADEIRAVFDAATRFTSHGSAHTARAFMLKAHNSEYAKTIRANTEYSGYPSYSMLGSIQPDVLHEIASDATNNDGMTHRLSVYFINENRLPKKTNKAPTVPMSVHNDWVKKAHRNLKYVRQTVTLSAKADAVRQRMDDWIDEQVAIYSYGNKPLSLALLKWRGYFARRCLIEHVITHCDDVARMPSAVSAETANHVFNYMTDILFEHTKAFYNLAGANDEHNILRTIVEHALIHRLEEFTAHDLAHGSRQLSKIDRPDLKRFMYKLEALGYGRIVVPGRGGTKKRFDSLWFTMNPYVFTRHVDLAKKLQERNALWAENWKAARQRKKERSEDGDPG